MSVTSRARGIRMPSIDEDRAITRAARSDPDAPPQSRRQLREMSPLHGLPGRPKAPNPKLLVSVRYDSEVIAYFRSTGDGWQSRMNEVLARYVGRKARGAR